MKHAAGSFAWLASDAAGATFTISGLPFQPKAIRVWIVALEEISLDTFNPNSTEAVNGLRSVGFATSTTNRRCVAAAEDDGAATMACFSGFRDDCVAMTLLNSSSALASGRLDLDAMLSDGFRLIIDATSQTVNVTVNWEAWGGDDITVAEAISIAEPAATGDVDYTVTGFAADGVGQAVMFAGVQNTNASPSEASAFDSGFCLGFAAGTAAADNVVVMGNQDTGSAAADTDGYCKTGECLGMIAVAGGNPSARAQLTQWNANGFRLNWIARATTNRRYIALAIKGGLWKAGSYTIAGNTLNATATVSGLTFQPIGVLFIGRMTAEQAAGTATAEDRMSIGQGISSSSRQALGYLSENGTGNAEVDQIRGTVGVLFYPTTAGGILAAYDLDAVNADGFRVIVDTAGGVASEWQAYLAFGSASVAVDAVAELPILTVATALAVADLPVEWRALLEAVVDAVVEVLAGIVGVADAPVEGLAGAAGVADAPVESLGTATVDAVGDLPVESLAALEAAADALVEALGGVAAVGDLPVETGLAVAAVADLVLESLAAAAAVADAPVEVLAALAAVADALVELLGGAAAVADAPVEALGAGAAVDAAAEAQVEWLATTAVDGVADLPVEGLEAPGVEAGATAPVEWTAAVPLVQPGAAVKRPSRRRPRKARPECHPAVSVVGPLAGGLAVTAPPRPAPPASRAPVVAVGAAAGRLAVCDPLLEVARQEDGFWIALLAGAEL